MEWSIISIQEQTTTSISVNVVKGKRVLIRPQVINEGFDIPTTSEKWLVVDSCPLEPQYVGASSAHSLFLLRALTTALEHSLRATQDNAQETKKEVRLAVVAVDPSNDECLDSGRRRTIYQH
uniref:Uncharacterized protein n=1 Tax=Vespula pensylvanica TaxID=30213 RepID=A0A834P6P1_VESPE|nr:hypothetical protein H0235_004186 [Vespula pensylvanica]